VGKNASFINTMIHHWGPEFIVRPRSAAIVEQGGAYTENYYSVKPPRSIETNPVTRLKGKDASAKYMSGIICLPGTHCDIGGTVYLAGENTSAELTARAVNHGGAVIQKGLLVGAAAGVRAHVDCSGLMLSDTGMIEAVPGLRSRHPDAKMSHEAAIGKIDDGAVNYLRSKGLSEMQAVSLIVRGFLNIDAEIGGLSSELESAIREIAMTAGHG
jgi:Fe-S cluster assembly scaffold protein SufB